MSNRNAPDAAPSSQSPAPIDTATATTMFDLKMCFLDFMRMTGATAAGSGGAAKQRKSLQELSDRYHADTPSYQKFQPHRGQQMLGGSAAAQSHYMQKYNDVNIIYFNENLSMTSKCNTIKFSRGPAAGKTFKQSPMNQSFSNRKKSIRDWEVDESCFDFLAAVDGTTSCSSSSSGGAGSSGSAGSSSGLVSVIYFIISCIVIQIYSIYLAAVASNS